MIDITSFINNFISILKTNFTNRIWFVGLQGSYARGEATEKSDIDIVVILDELNTSDIEKYNLILNSLPHRELFCGFLSGKNELLNWDTADLFQFYYDTKPIIGSIDCLLPLIDKNTIKRAVKTGVCNIFHGTVHNMLYEKSEEILKDLYKSASFIIQAICFIENENYISDKKDLLQSVSSEEKIILNNFLNIKKDGQVYFKEMSNDLFKWSQKWIMRIN